MASKRPGDDDNNGHAAAGDADGPDSKKAKSVSFINLSTKLFIDQTW